MDPVTKSGESFILRKISEEKTLAIFSNRHLPCLTQLDDIYHIIFSAGIAALAFNIPAKYCLVNSNVDYPYYIEFQALKCWRRL